MRDFVSYDTGLMDTADTGHRVYDSFGNLISQSGLTSRIGFTGRPFDETTGLQNNLNRWFDSTVGRWLSEDPIGFWAEDSNLQRYVENSPTNHVDPNGLDSVDTAIIEAVATGNVGMLQTLLASGGLSATQTAAINAAIARIAAQEATKQAAAAATAATAAAQRAAAQQQAAQQQAAQQFARQREAHLRSIQQQAAKQQAAKPQAAKPQQPAAPKVRARKKPGLSGKEAADDVPSWAEGKAPWVGQSADDFATELCDAKFGKGNWKKGAGHDYNKIHKWRDRAFLK